MTAIDRAGRALAERDEAREALRDLLDTLKAVDKARPIFYDPDGSSEPLNIALAQFGRARARAIAVLEGVERTHALVPVGVLKEASEIAKAYDDIAGGYIDEESIAGQLGRLFEAAARGELVEWPS